MKSISFIKSLQILCQLHIKHAQHNKLIYESLLVVN